MESGMGLALWKEVSARLASGANRASARGIEEPRAVATGSPGPPHPTLGPATLATIDPPRYSTPTLVAPRLGQGSFRALVTDVSRYRCAISNERTLPVLQAPTYVPTQPVDNTNFQTVSQRSPHPL